MAAYDPLNTETNLDQFGKAMPMPDPWSTASPAAQQSMGFGATMPGSSSANNGDWWQQFGPSATAGQAQQLSPLDRLANGAGTFQAPTAEQAAQTPGYQFSLSEGLKGLNSGAFARGQGLTGGLMKAQGQYATNLANTTYGDTFNRAATAHGLNYGELMGLANLSKPQGV